MRYEIVLSPESVRDLERLEARVRAEVRDALERHPRHQPGKVSRGRIKRLRGLRHPQHRLMVGEVRVFYDIAAGAVEVLAIVRKSEAAAWLGKTGESP